MEWRFFPAQPFPVATISEYTPRLATHAILPSMSDTESGRDDRQDDIARISLFWVVSRFAIQPSSEGPVSVTISSTGLIYIAKHPNFMQRQIELLTWGIENAISHLPREHALRNSRRILHKPPEGTLIGVRPTKAEVIVYLDQAVIIPTKKEGRTINLYYTLLQLYNTKRNSHEKTRWTET